MTLSTTFNRIQKETVQVDLTNIDGQPDNTTQITVANSNPAAVSVTPSGSLPTRVFNLVGTIVGNSVVTFTAGALSGSIAVAVTPSPDMSSMTITLGPITSKF